MTVRSLVEASTSGLLACLTVKKSPCHLCAFESTYTKPLVLVGGNEGQQILLSRKLALRTCERHVLGSSEIWPCMPAMSGYISVVETGTSIGTNPIFRLLLAVLVVDTGGSSDVTFVYSMQS